MPTPAVDTGKILIGGLTVANNMAVYFLNKDQANSRLAFGYFVHDLSLLTGA